jgi:hypothetical protein
MSTFGGVKRTYRAIRYPPLLGVKADISQRLPDLSRPDL